MHRFFTVAELASAYRLPKHVQEQLLAEVVSTESGLVHRRFTVQPKSGYSRGLTDTNRPSKAGEGIGRRHSLPFLPRSFSLGGSPAAKNDPATAMGQLKPSRKARGGSKCVNMTASTRPFFVSSTRRLPMIEKHELLSEYQDKRIQITGVFDRYSFVLKDYREIKTALLQDVYAHIDGKDVDLGHVWLQNADPLKPLGLNFGDRIQCKCRVRTYKKRLPVPNRDGLMVENKISLCWPTEVEVVSRLQPVTEKASQQTPVSPAYQGPVQPTSTQPASDSDGPTTPAKLIFEVRRLARLAGGLDTLQELVEALRSES
jgi:hypothetical protein